MINTVSLLERFSQLHLHGGALHLGVVSLVRLRLERALWFAVQNGFAQVLTAP